MAIASATPDGTLMPNHPLATRMGVVAGVAHNMIVGSIFGTFSVLIASVEQRMGVSPEQAALGIPLVIVVSSLLSPVIGVLASKYSLRLMLFVGAVMATLAFLMLAFSTNYIAYLVAYALLLGPAMSLAGSIGPATLVTRWFTRHRGLAMGLVHLPIVVAILPVLSNWVLENYGAQTTYLMVAALVGIGLLPLTLLTVNHPPANNDPLAQALSAHPSDDQSPAEAGSADTGKPHNVSIGDGSMTVVQLLKKPVFWALNLSAAAIATGAVTLGTILIPMAVSWGIERGDAAILASVMSLVGIVGSVAFGWVADRLGGAKGLALLAMNCAILWAILLIHPPFPVLIVVIGLIGMHGAGMIPNMSRGISDIFGAESFSRGFGLFSLVNLPFTVIAIVGSQAIYSSTGSYSGAIIAIIGFLVIGTGCAVVAARK